MRSLLHSAATLTFVAASAILNPCFGAAVDFTTFTVEDYPEANTFVFADWSASTANTAVHNNNPGANVFYGDFNVHDTRITGSLLPGTDDDMVGFVFGFEPGDATFNFFPPTGEYLLIDWKGATQNFNFADPAGGNFFHDQTLGGIAPVGLALSRVTGLPTADELWQHDNFELDNPDGGVEPIARGATLGSAPYDRSGTPPGHTFDITYTPTQITVIVDGVTQFDVSGSFPDGRFGLYTLGQGFPAETGPFPVYSNFEVFNLDELVTATIDRGTGQLEFSNPTGGPLDFRSYSITSGGGGLDPAGWLSISDNYDAGNANSVDSDAWSETSATDFLLAEGEAVPGDGAVLANGASLDLGNLWRRSPIEDLQMEVELIDGTIAPVRVVFSGGPGNQPYVEGDLNVDGAITVADFTIFAQNSLADLSGVSVVEAVLRGDMDGDKDNDVFDFALFKGVFDDANGAGAFAAMLAEIPEPTTGLLATFALLGLAARRRGCGLGRVAGGWIGMALILPAATVVAAPVDFLTFTSESFPHADSNTDPAGDAFPIADWTAETTSNVATLNSNATPNVFYSPFDVAGKLITGTLNAGSDDDVVGFAFGFQPGNAALGDPSISTADYLLIDWKGATQTFNFRDFADTGNVFHDLTEGATSTQGIALSRVTGLPTADEFWGRAGLPENPGGSVEQLARGMNFGSTGYPRSEDVDFELRFTTSQITLKINGVPELNVGGDFQDGRFGLFTNGQGPAPVFSNFDMIDLTDADLLTALVHRDTGEIEIQNNTQQSIDFDYYSLSSASGSLSPAGWNSLSSQDFQSTGAGIGESWEEAGGSDANELGELFLRSSSSLGSSSAVSLGDAYNPALGGEDVLLTYRLPSGEVEAGIVTYIGEAAEVAGDYDGDSQVLGADFLAWQNQFGDNVTPGSGADGNGNGVVDGPDLGIWENFYGVSAAAATAHPIPEPAAIWLVLLGSPALFPLARRRRR